MSPNHSERHFTLGRLRKGVPSTEIAVGNCLENRANDTKSGAEGRVTTQQLAQIAQSVDGLYDLVSSLHQQDSTVNKAFDTLYNELHTYKNDFFYERLKPFVRALLFVIDSMQHYRDEVSEAEKNDEVLEASSVKASMSHMIEELLDALFLIEVMPLENADDAFNPRQQRAIEVAAVCQELDGKILKIVRPGYTIGGNMLRPADVVVGKTTKPSV